MTRGIRLALLACITLMAAPLTAQDVPPLNRPGRIVGRVTDAATGDPIPGAQVTLEGTNISGRTDLTGRFTLLGVPAGLHTVTVRVIGFAPKSVTGVDCATGAVVPLDVALSATAIEVAAVEVTAEIERGSVTSAIEAQRSATQIVSAISQEQIKKSPDSDAGQVMQRVSGVSVQDGKYVFVRGLGERYTTTSLNNARIPSPEPERKVVPLDLFPSGLIQTIVTSKTFTPEQPGDFSGAQVDLRTREFPSARMLTLSTSAGFNSLATFKNVIAAPRLGSEWFGFAGAERTIPTPAAGNLSSLSQPELNELMASFRNAWTPWVERGKPNGSFAVSLGGEEIIGRHPLGYVASLSYSESQEVRHEEERANTRSDGTVLDYSSGATGTVGVLWGGLVNLTRRLGSTSTISFNNTYTRSADNQATRHVAYKEEFQRVFDVTRLTFVERSVWSNQLRGQHLLADRHSLQWSLSTSGVRRYEPDRSDLRYETDTSSGTPQPSMWQGTARSATRTFSDLTENILEGSVGLGLTFGTGESQWRFKVGGSYRALDRHADTRAFDMQNLALTDSQRLVSPEQLFDGTHARAGAFLLVPDNFLGRYQADDGLAAGFVQLEAPLSSRIRLIAGVRVERWSLDLATSVTPQPIVRRNIDALPALALNMRLSQTHALRLSASQTLARPEFREISPTGYRDFIGGLDVFGDTSVQRSLIQNLDTRWEWYPNPGELVSVGVFAKNFVDPIEKIIVGTTATEALSFRNAEGATSLGFEVELRKNLVTVSPALAPFSVFANATLMHSRIRPGSLDLTNADRPMVGQAGQVLNTGVSFTAPNGGFSATLLYNLVGRRVAEAGSNPRPDAYEEARDLLDLSLQVALPWGASLKLDGKNLFDTPVHITQGSITRLRYTTGRVFSLGLSWQP